HSSTSISSIDDRQSIAEDDAHRSRGVDQVEVEGHALRLPHHVLEPPRDDVRRIERDHRAELALMNQLNGLAAEACRQHAIETGWGTSALEMPEHHRSRFLSGFLGKRCTDL